MTRKTAPLPFNEVLTTAKMLGRLGWFGQCACCSGNRGKREMKRLEKRRWQREEL